MNTCNEQTCYKPSKRKNKILGKENLSPLQEKAQQDKGKFLTKLTEIMKK